MSKQIDLDTAAGWTVGAAFVTGVTTAVASLAGKHFDPFLTVGFCTTIGAGVAALTAVGTVADQLRTYAFNHPFVGQRTVRNTLFAGTMATAFCSAITCAESLGIMSSSDKSIETLLTGEFVNSKSSANNAPVITQAQPVIDWFQKGLERS